MNCEENGGELLWPISRHCYRKQLKLLRTGTKNLSQSSRYPWWDANQWTWRWDCNTRWP